MSPSLPIPQLIPLVIPLALAAVPARASGEPTPLALSCTSCHVSSMTQSAPIVSLDAYTEQQIATALRDYASGQRPGTIMPRLAPGLSEAEIVALARYFGRDAQTRPDRQPRTERGASR